MRKQIITTLFCIVGITASAQITLENCKKWARENYPEVKRYDIISATEACNISNASKNWLPIISLKAQGGWVNSTADFNEFLSSVTIGETSAYRELVNQIFDTSKIKAIPNWQYRFGLEVVQPVYDGGAISLQKEVARRQAEADRAKIEVSLHALEEKVIDVYFAILLLEDRKEQVEIRTELLDKNLEKLKNLQKEDIVKQNDVDAVEVEKLKLKQASDVVDENLETYRLTLGLLTGHAIGDQELQRPEMPTGEKPAYSETAEMQYLSRQSELLSLQERYEKVKTMPKIGVLGQAFYGFPGNNIFRDLVDRSPQLNLAIGLNVSWDISPFYKKHNNLLSMKLQQETINNARDLLIYRQRITNTSLETKLKRLKKVREQDDEIIALREKLREAEEVKIDNDMADATALLAKISDESDAKLQRSIHESELMLDIYKLHHFGDAEK